MRQLDLPDAGVCFDCGNLYPHPLQYLPKVDVPRITLYAFVTLTNHGIAPINLCPDCVIKLCEEQKAQWEPETTTK